MSTKEATGDGLIENTIHATKKPPYEVKPSSYVNISRSINGYTSSLKTYDSKKREVRSRDCSPINARTVYYSDMDEQTFMNNCTITDTVDFRNESSNSIVVERIQKYNGLSLNVYPKKEISNNIPMSTIDLPVLRFLNPQFRAKLPIKVPSKKTKTTPITNGNGVEVFNGSYFINLVNLECDSIKKLISQVECLLPIAPEYGQDRIQAIVGKSNLLMSQKIEQFLGLCEKNLSCALDDLSRPKNNDLEGFWDLVMIQINQVKTEMQEIIEQSNKGWPKEEDENKEKPIKIIKKIPKAKKPVVSSLKYDTARRKALFEERRKALKNLKSDDVIFF